MAQAGGALALESPPGKGTTAELWLPLAAPIRVDLTFEEEMTQPIVPFDRQPNILVVDDDPLVLMNAVLMLEDLGDTTTQAASADEALQILGQGPLPDILVTDQAMPRITGEELAREVIARYPGLPIILATGYGELPSGEGLWLARLAKPFTQAQLNDALSAAITTS